MQPLHGLYPNMETCNHDILLQHKKGEEKVPLHQQCTTWILISPWWHQTLCERQQMWICYWLAIVPNKWSLYQYLEGEELVLEYAKFQLQQREIFWPDCRLSTNVTLPIHSFHLCRPLNLDALSTSNFSKIMHHNAIIRAIEDTNKLENDGLMDKYYVVGVIAIPYPWLSTSSLRRTSPTVSQLVPSHSAQAQTLQNGPLMLLERGKWM